jgi:Uncharacterised nucleotidyltransferase
VDVSRAPSGRVLAAARTLRVDATTAEVLREFGAAGCRSILLKGPALQRELQPDGQRRSYGDTDLLVAPADLERAGELLTELGFVLVMDHRHHPGVSEPHAQEWMQARSGASVDLHWRLAGAGLAAERAWEILAAHTVPIEVGGAGGESLSRAGVALVVALHAAHHGETHPKPLRDLERSLAAFERATWEAAALLAAELDAGEAFAAGLRLVPEGARLAAGLDLGAVRSPRRRLLASSQPPGSLGLLRVLESRGPRARARAVRHELLPAPSFMRATTALARRGPAGLALAYPVRAAARARALPAAVRAVRRARAAP